jgi:2-dehydro-3-deoxyphosphogluconate aldolase / (4S)-4-hydroxy-2-oxoglutarate aldolase
MPTVAELCALAPVIPVLTVERIEDAAPLARALARGGLPVLEVTLRTPVALAAIAQMRTACPEAIVGAGTLCRPADVAACRDVGAVFGVSPGAPAALMDAVKAAGLAFLPGCATATEAMALSDRGYKIVKFFPAEAAGGAGLLKSLSSPLPHIGFCPTGGVTLENAPDYLALANVRVVGGSWVAPKSAVDAGDWDAIEALARDAVARLRPTQP